MSGGNGNGTTVGGGRTVGEGDAVKVERKVCID